MTNATANGRGWNTFFASAKTASQRNDCVLGFDGAAKEWQHARNDLIAINTLMHVIYDRRREECRVAACSGTSLAQLG
jgi:hypothetical protein